MGRFDRERWLALTTAVLAGVTVMTIGRIAGRMVEVLSVPVPLWSLLGVAAAAVTIVVFGGVQWRRRPNKVFLLVHAFSQKHWVAELIQHLHSALDRRQYELVLKISDPNYTAFGQRHHLRRIRRHRHEYVGGFVIAAEVDSAETYLREFCRDVKFPVVFMDVDPFPGRRDYPPKSASVGYDADEIGRAAANWLADQFEATGAGPPTVLVVGSRSQCQRQHAFVATFRSLVPGAAVVLEDDGEFARMRGQETVHRCFRELQYQGRELHAIFCTSDEMALGAIDFLLTLDPAASKKIIIVGVDGTREAVALIDTGSSPLRCTVVQNSERVAGQAVDLLVQMINGEPYEVRQSLPPKTYTAKP